jgi:hypothetical protein
VKKAILTAPGEHPLAALLAEEALAKGMEALKVLFSPRAKAEAGGVDLAKKDGIAQANYSPGSFVSARTVFIEALTVFESLEAAIFIYSPSEAVRKALSGIDLDEIEEFADTSVKGEMLLVKEAAAYFAGRGRGSLVFVLPTANEEGAGLFDYVSKSVFKGLAQAAFDGSTELVPAFGFQCQAEADRAFARFVLKTIEESPRKTAGRWLKYSGKGGLFGIF